MSYKTMAAVMNAYGSDHAGAQMSVLKHKKSGEAFWFPKISNPSPGWKNTYRGNVIQETGLTTDNKQRLLAVLNQKQNSDIPVSRRHFRKAFGKINGSYSYLGDFELDVESSTKSGTLIWRKVS